MQTLSSVDLRASRVGFSGLGLRSAVARVQPATGAIAGRVADAPTRGYGRNAGGRVGGSRRGACTEDPGAYGIAGVPAGEVTVTLGHTGTQAATRGSDGRGRLQLRDVHGSLRNLGVRRTF
jgi:hypothetical protein